MLKKVSELPGFRKWRRWQDAIAVAPALDLALASVNAPRDHKAITRRTLLICVLAVGVGFVAAILAEVLIHLIGFITNIAFYGRISFDIVSPGDTEIGLLILVVPVVGALLIGLMARYGSSAIRGHGIPEVMEKVLHGESRIPVRLMFLKPLSAAIAIGTGGPFGAEGPIIATGGALGSLVGQMPRMTTDERKILLAAGAAAGMTAVFGAPVAAVLLAVELLLFEYKARSIIPVALASAVAAGVRMALVGSDPIFPLPDIVEPGGAALASYVVLGALIGVLSVYVTRAVYAIEDAFERLPIHWMWWPALGAVVVGVIGYIEPRTLGVGYSNISGMLSGSIAGTALLWLVILKFVSWAIYLGSGTSGGTLAPLFTIGGGAGALLGALAVAWLPMLGVDPSLAALVGMAAIFAGASHAVLTSVIFAFEITHQSMGLLPLLGGCTASYLISLLMMRSSIMTEKLVRRGTHVRTEYSFDYLGQIPVGSIAVRKVTTVAAEDELGTVRRWLASGVSGTGHQGFPVVNNAGEVIGLLTLRDILDPLQPEDAKISTLIKRPVIVAYTDNSLREAADHMVIEGVGRLPVVERDKPLTIVGIITRSDLLGAHRPRLNAIRRPGMRIPFRH